MEKKGQMSIIGLVMFVALLIAFVAMWPTIDNQIVTFTDASNNTGLNFIIESLPVFIGLGLLITLFMFVQPYR